MKYITEKHIEAASNHKIPYGQLGEIIDTRTYLRYLPEEQRRETPYERNARVTNYNVGLADGKQSYEELYDEAHLMFDKMNRLKAWASGRVAWVGGTKVTDTVPEACFNCAALAVNRLGAFTEAFHLLMLGCGVGFRVLDDDIKDLPPIVQKVSTAFKTYNEKQDKVENTKIITNRGRTTIYVGDSREGWVSALEYYLRCFTEEYHPSFVTFNFNNVRPRGQRIKGFGGTASGHEPLQDLFTKIHDVLSNCGNRIRPIDAMDIMCAIGHCVVAGNVRRSAEICLFDPYNEQMSNAKKGLWTDKEMSGKRYRAMSNNSGVYFDKPSMEKLKDIFKSIKTEGEPGFINGSAHKQRRFKAAKTYRHRDDVWNYVHSGGLTNPCGEILLSTGYAGLKAGSFCNLTALPLPAFVTPDRKVDYGELVICLRLITRIGLRQTCVNISLGDWDTTQKRERLLGVDCCGWVEFFNMLGWPVNGREANNFRVWCKNVANEEATRYAKVLDVPRPLLVTTCKPNGTYAQLNTISSGIHWPYAPYYIRRVRMSSHDPLARTLKESGVPTYPEVFQLEKIFNTHDVWDALKQYESLKNKDEVLKQVDTWVLEFPIKTNALEPCNDVPAITQLENYKNTVNFYCDHNASCTITVGDDEWDFVIEWVYDNWDSIVAVSFLPKTADDAYPLLPYQAITKNQYEQMNPIPDVNWELLTAYERELDDPDNVDLESDCEGGSCPIR